MTIYQRALPLCLALSIFFGISGCNKDQPAVEQNAASAVELDSPTASVTAINDDGRALFQTHCAVCHPGGGNIINPQKTLDGATLAANGIETVGDIIANMRQPGPGMTRFDENLLPDRQAASIAEYILNTY